MIGNNKKIVTELFHLRATNFVPLYKDEIVSSGNINLYLNSNVVHIQANQYGAAVKDLEIACLNGNRFRVAAKVFILATGGIETGRENHRP